MLKQGTPVDVIVSTRAMSKGKIIVMKALNVFGRIRHADIHG